MFAGVLAAIAGVIVSGFAHAAATGGFHFPSRRALSPRLAISGLAQATLLTTYCYWGYYNIMLSGRRGAPAGANDSARHSAVGVVCLRILRVNESGCAAVAARCRGARDRERTCAGTPGGGYCALRLRHVGRIPDGRAHHLDCLRVSFLAAARLLARALRRCPRRQLLSAFLRRFIPSTTSPTVRLWLWAWLAHSSVFSR